MSLDHCERCGQPHPKCHAHPKHGPLRPCMVWPPRGQDVCTKHGGGARQIRGHAKRRVALGEAEEELNRLGVPIEIEPADAMLQMVWEAAGNVAVLRGWIQRLRQAEQLIEGYDEEDIIDSLASVGQGKTVARSQRGVIAGRVDPANWKAAPHVLVVMYNDERERLVRWAKACRDAGVEEHRVKLAERQGELLAQVLRVFLEGLLAALVSAGAPEPLVRQVWTSEVPGIVRRALGEASGEEPALGG